MAKKLYDKDSIESLDPREFTRLRPSVYCGDTTYATQLAVEIFSNAVDEFRSGNGDKIEITTDGAKCCIKDCGQGFLVNEVREDGKTILEAAFSVLNTSGKYRADGSYEGTSLGSFGIGAKLAIYLSSKAKVTTYRDKKYETIWFKDGLFQKRTTGATTHASGTTVEWEADPQFFTNATIEDSSFANLLKVTSCLCPGLTIVYNDKKFKSTNGIADLLDEKVADKEILKKRWSLNYTNGKYKIDLVGTFTSAYGATVVPYVNTGLTETGPHITGIKAAITREFNKFFKEQKWLKGDNFTGDNLQEGMYLVFNITAPSVLYDAQVKSRIVKLDMAPLTNAISESLQEYLNKNKKDAKLIFDKATNAKKAADAAKKARDLARQHGEKKSTKRKFLDLPTKLVDCNSKSRLDCEILLVEGDSAASGLVEARDPEIQAVFPLRGKIVSSLKNSPDKVFANQEVNSIIKALGLQLNVKTNKLIYDKNKLRYGKILLAMDGDPDGGNIRALVLELLWWLCPELITNGHVYSTLPPLFRVTTKSNKYVYLTDAAALDEYKRTHAGQKYKVNRNKGLGEQDSSELRECLIDPATRNIRKIVVGDYAASAALLECLMGKNVAPRREYLLKHSEEAED